MRRTQGAGSPVPRARRGIKEHRVSCVVLPQHCPSGTLSQAVPQPRHWDTRRITPPWLCNICVICITENYCPTIIFRLLTVILCTHMPNRVSIGQCILEDLNHPSACLHGCKVCGELTRKLGFTMVNEGTGCFSIPALLVLGIPHFMDFSPLI